MQKNFSNSTAPTLAVVRYLFDQCILNARIRKLF